MLIGPNPLAAALVKARPPLYLGQVATRCRIPQAVSGANTQINSASAHVSRDDIASIQVGFVNWYTPVGSSGESNGGAVDTFTASIEIVPGTFTQFTFGGVANGAPLFTPGSLLLSDPLPVSIPKNTQFRIRTWRAASGGNIVFCTDTSTVIRNAAMGDVMHYGTSGQTDETLGGAISQTATGSNQYYPALILAQTRMPSIIGFGNSRMFGRADTAGPSTVGDMGNTFRALGPLFGYCNAATSQDRLSWFLAAHSLRFQLLPYFSHAIVEYPTNDIFADLRTAAQCEADLQTIYPLIRAGLAWPAKVGQNTIEPETTSTGNGAGAAGSSERLLLNAAIRAGLGQDFTNDVAAVAQSAADNTLWANAAWLNDPIHENQTGYIAVSGGVNYGAIRR